MINKLKIGNFLFKNRSFTTLPLILALFLFFKPMSFKNAYIILGLAISILGEIIRIIAVGFSYRGTSGRENFLRAERLNKTGIYSIVRNPLYIGNFLIFTGLLIVFSNIFAIIIFQLYLIFQYYFIIISEENYLSNQFGDLYNEYRKNVNRIIPRFKNYQRPENGFNLKKVILKENDSIFNLLVMFVLILIYKEKIQFNKVINLTCYLILIFLFILMYIGVKIYKKKTINES